MKQIVLTRIDDRLIHGQVVTAWVKHTNGNKIVIIDDALAKDNFMQKILKAAAPPQISVDVFNAKTAAEMLKGETDENERLILLVKTPEIIENFINEEIIPMNINLGGMGAKPGRKKFYRNVSASQEEIASMKRIINKGGSIQLQLVPGERPVDVKGILEGGKL